MKLMIVDDHAGVRNLIRQLVGSNPETVVWECSCGDDAVREAARFQPDVVTMDVRMPGMNGFTATRALLGVHPSARVIIVTLSSHIGVGEAAAACGASAYVLKENLVQLKTVFLQHGFESGASNRSEYGKR